MAGAAGGFVTRAFESMLKECANNKKYSALQTAIQTYLDNAKNSNKQSSSIGTTQTASSAEAQSLPEAEAGSVKDATGPEQLTAPSPSHSTEASDATGKPSNVSESITTVLANAGHTLGGADAELVLSPLRLAFETKNAKMSELALDCLHKLIAYEHLEGDPGLDGGINGPLFTDILNMVCGCVDNSSPDSCCISQVQRHVLLPDEFVFR